VSARARRGEPLDEGRLLADHAAVLQIRNRIEVATVGEGRDFDADEYRADARTAVEALATEQEAVADRLDEERQRIRWRLGPADSQHDYRRGDRRNLRVRARTARDLAAELRARAADPAYVESLVERAREDAWRDIAGEIRRQLRVREAPPVEADPAREARIADLAAELAGMAAAVDEPDYGF